MNKTVYDLTNLIGIIIISYGVFGIYGADIALIVSGALGLLLNLMMLYVATCNK